MTEAELTKLLDVARRRPLPDAQTVRTGKRKGHVVAKDMHHAVARPYADSFQTPRHEKMSSFASVYGVKSCIAPLGALKMSSFVTPVATRRRRHDDIFGGQPERCVRMGHKAERNESLRSGSSRRVVAQLRLEGRVAFAELDAADAKNREGNAVPIRDDLAADLRAWLADRIAELMSQSLPVCPAKPDCSSSRRNWSKFSGERIGPGCCWQTHFQPDAQRTDLSHQPGRTKVRGFFARCGSRVARRRSFSETGIVSK
jgi:hypothetical protein